MTVLCVEMERLIEVKHVMMGIQQVETDVIVLVKLNHDIRVHEHQVFADSVEMQ